MSLQAYLPTRIIDGKNKIFIIKKSVYAYLIFPGLAIETNQEKESENWKLRRGEVIQCNLNVFAFIWTISSFLRISIIETSILLY